MRSVDPNRHRLGGRRVESRVTQWVSAGPQYQLVQDFAQVHYRDRAYPGLTATALFAFGQVVYTGFRQVTVHPGHVAGIQVPDFQLLYVNEDKLTS